MGFGSAFKKLTRKPLDPVGKLVNKAIGHGFGSPDLAAGYYEAEKQAKWDDAQQTALANEAQRVQASNNAADAVNQTIIDAKRKRRNTALLAPAAGGTPLGGVQTALGQAGTYGGS